jgi:hypothetical protein
MTQSPNPIEAILEQTAKRAEANATGIEEIATQENYK